MEGRITSQVGQDRLQLHQAVPLSTPLVIYIEPSGYCNLRCSFCPQGSSPNGLKKDRMSVDLFKKLIDDIASFSGRIKLIRVCGNGEPLTNNHLPAMLRYAWENRAADKIELITNGLLLHSEWIDCLPAYLTRLVCSIEGLSAEEYQRICRVEIDYDDFVGKLERLYTAKQNCIIHIKTHQEAVSTPEKKDLFLKLFQDKCDEIFIEKIVPMWPQTTVPFSSNEFRWSDEAVIPRKVCAQIFKGVQVQADGEVVPCCVDWKRINLLGNLHRESLFEIWNGEKIKQLQIEHLCGNKNLLWPCQDCRMNDYCEIDNLDDHAENCLSRIQSKEHA